MINIGEVIETNDMVEKENLDVRTITLGISLLDCIDSDLAKVNENIYNKITTLAKDLVATGKEIENNYCIPGRGWMPPIFLAAPRSSGGRTVSVPVFRPGPERLSRPYLPADRPARPHQTVCPAAG